MNPLSIRSSGILLHPTSLPGQHGCGDFGQEAYRFVDWLVQTGQSLWQMLPLGEVGPGNSPYMSSSAFAGNLMLIDLHALEAHRWLTPDELIAPLTFSDSRVDYPAVIAFKTGMLRLAAGRFFAQPGKRMGDAYAAFCEREKHWLDDFALFKALWAHESWRDWSEWPEELVKRDPGALGKAAKQHADEIAFWKFCQWCFDTQWKALRKYANERGVYLVGDVPIFVAYQSADVWAHQDLFELDEHGRCTVVAGVPPDYFSATGQLWGNPLYRWSAHEESGYEWWIARLRHAFNLFDLVRVDHFRGFADYWEIPAGAPNAIDGQWMPGPGAALFEALLGAFKELPIIAEDLGLITAEVIALRDKFNLPGMRILQFAFGEDERNYFLPHHYTANSVAYTGTHDNDTSIGWWQKASDHERDFAQSYLRTDGQEINWVMMGALSASVANAVIFPLQDVLGLDSAHRMNMPGTGSGNWEWRITPDIIASCDSGRLAGLANRDKRDPRRL